MSLPIIVNGALGKMGSQIGALVLEDAELLLAAAVETTRHPCIGKDYGLCIDKKACGVNVSGSYTFTDRRKRVIIDFSSPKSAEKMLGLAVGSRMCLIIGTTGLTEETLSAARKAAKHIPILVSPNMSLGVNLLFSLTELVSKKLKNDFDIEIIEAHHRFKKDAPSGTARRLGEIVAATYGLPYARMACNGRAGLSPAGRKKNEVGMHALRGGDIVGDHTVLFAGIGERIELRHMAHSRATLARGAVIAAKWIITQKPGYYSMRDVLGI